MAKSGQKQYFSEDAVSNMSSAQKASLGIRKSGATGEYFGFKPMPTSTNIATMGSGVVVSSDSVLGNRDSKEAISAAGNALTSQTNEPGLTSMFNPVTDINGLQANVMNTEVQNQIGRVGASFSALDAIDASFDARLARSNRQYRNQMQDLKSSFETQKQIATQQAAALNPYSQAQGAMTARNFQGAIESEYQKQAQRLTEAADLAQNELEAGRYAAYTEIQNAMEESNRQFKSNMAKFMLDAQNQFNTAQQQEREFGLDVARFGLEQDQFGLQQQEFGENRFMDFVNQFSQDPTFKQNLNMFYETGEINEGLMPLIERGMAAGLSPNETLALSQYETFDQRESRIGQEQFQQQMGVQWYNAETSRMNAIRQIQADAEKTKTKNTTAQIFNTRAQTIIDKGYEALGKLAEGGLGQTGVLGQITGIIKSSAAGDLESVYNTIRGNISFDTLAQMRAESPTGGALGQVSNFEGQLLMDAEGSLSAGLQRDTQISNLTNIMAAYVNTQTAVSLDAQVEQGLINQEAANQLMIENMVSGEDILADFNARQIANQSGTQPNSQSTSPSTYTSPSGNTYNLPN